MGGWGTKQLQLKWFAATKRYKEQNGAANVLKNVFQTNDGHKVTSTNLKAPRYDRFQRFIFILDSKVEHACMVLIISKESAEL